MSSVLAWYFHGGALRYDDGREVKPGAVHEVDPDRLSLCRYGLHASRDIFDALEYAPGAGLARVRLSGRILHDKDKLCGERREYLWAVSPEEGELVLRKFARLCALDVAHLWESPDVVLRYLKTGDPALRAAARDAAWAAARDAARKKQRRRLIAMYGAKATKP